MPTYVPRRCFSAPPVVEHAWDVRLIFSGAPVRLGFHRTVDDDVAFPSVGRGGAVSHAVEVTKIATVISADRNSSCTGIAVATAASCTPCANLGTGALLTGNTAATCVTTSQSPCCNLPYFYLEYAGQNVLQYAFFELMVLPPVPLLPLPLALMRPDTS